LSERQQETVETTDQWEEKACFIFIMSLLRDEDESV